VRGYNFWAEMVCDAGYYNTFVIRTADWRRHLVMGLQDFNTSHLIFPSVKTWTEHIFFRIVNYLSQ